MALNMTISFLKPFPTSTLDHHTSIKKKSIRCLTTVPKGVKTLGYYKSTQRSTSCRSKHYQCRKRTVDLFHSYVKTAGSTVFSMSVQWRLLHSSFSLFCFFLFPGVCVSLSLSDWNMAIACRTVPPLFYSHFLYSDFWQPTQRLNSNNVFFSFSCLLSPLSCYLSFHSLS